MVLTLGGRSHHHAVSVTGGGCSDGSAQAESARAYILSPKPAYHSLHWLLLLTFLTVSGCSGEKSVKWQEEVLLKDGPVIVIERTQQYRRVGEPGQGSGWLFDQATLKALLPGSDKAITWEGNVQPLVLDVGAGSQPYLLATVQTYHGKQKYRVPEGTWYVAFRHEQGKWTQIPLAQFPRNLKPNLLASTGELFVNRQAPSDSFVRLNLKQQLDSRPTVAEHYRKLVNVR